MKYIIWLVLCFITNTYAQPIEFIVKAAVGGPDDILSRRIADHLERTTDMKFVIVNKPGAAHAIGYSYFENTSHPALLLGDVNIQSHPVYSIAERIFTIGEFTNILFVRKNSSIESLNDLIELSKTREIKFGHGGIGTFSHTAATSMCEKIKCLLVPYKSGAPGMIDLMTGQIDAFALISYGSSVYMNNDNYIPIVMYSNTKHPKYNVALLPSSMKSMEIKNWIALFSRNLSVKQNKDITKAMSMIDKSFLIDNGLWIK